MSISASSTAATAAGGRTSTRFVRCIACAKPIPADAFTYTSAARKRVIAGCPACGKQMSLPTATWLRWSV